MVKNCKQASGLKEEVQELKLRIRDLERELDEERSKHKWGGLAQKSSEAFVKAVTGKSETLALEDIDEGFPTLKPCCGATCYSFEKAGKRCAKPCKSKSAFCPTHQGWTQELYEDKLRTNIEKVIVSRAKEEERTGIVLCSCRTEKGTLCKNTVSRFKARAPGVWEEVTGRQRCDVHMNVGNWGWKPAPTLYAGKRIEYTVSGPPFVPLSESESEPGPIVRTSRLGKKLKPRTLEFDTDSDSD